MPSTDFPKFLFTQLSDLIRQADAKAQATFYVLGITTAALLARLNAIKASGVVTMMWLGAFMLSVLLILLALKSIIAVIFPRLSPGSKTGLVYFRDILAHEPDEFVRAGLALSEDDAARRVYEQVYRLAAIADAKYRALRYALTLTGLAIVSAILVLFLT